MQLKIIGDHIQKMEFQFPLTSKFHLKILLLEWLKTSVSTIVDLKGKNCNTESLIWIKTNNNMYKIYADTKRKGVNTFLKTKQIKTDSYESLSKSGLI